MVSVEDFQLTNSSSSRQKVVVQLYDPSEGADDGRKFFKQYGLGEADSEENTFTEKDIEVTGGSYIVDVKIRGNDAVKNTESNISIPAGGIPDSATLSVDIVGPAEARVSLEE